MAFCLFSISSTIFCWISRGGSGILIFSKEDLVNKKEEYSDKHIEELLKKSNFSEFEKNTNDELKKTKEKSHFDSCINQIRNLELSEEIKNILKGIGAKEKENKEKFDKLIESFDFQKIKIDYEKWADFDNDEIPNKLRELFQQESGAERCNKDSKGIGIQGRSVCGK